MSCLSVCKIGQVTQLVHAAAGSLCLVAAQRALVARIVNGNGAHCGASVISEEVDIGLTIR